jgi:AbrB family looped-hinge helix DNA binding protein
MSLALTMDSAGRIVLPADVRRRLNLVPGSRLQLDVVAQRIELTPQAAEDSALLARTGRRLLLRTTGVAQDAGAVTRHERDAQARRGKAG